MMDMMRKVLAVPSSVSGWVMFSRQIGALVAWPPGRMLAFAFLVLVASFIAVRYALVIRDGGQYWVTGDWLIHWRSGPVRRGLTGSLILWLTDRTGAQVLNVALALQAAVWVAVVGLALRLFVSVPASAPVLMLMVSPILLQMAFQYHKLAMTKEIIGWLAMALIAMTALAGNRVWLWAGCAMLGLAGFAHEINAFLAPGALVFLWIYWRQGIVGRTEALAAAALVGLSCGAALLFSAIFKGHGLYAPICAELMRYGDLSLFCIERSPIWWLEQDTAYGIAFTWATNVESGAWPMFVLGYAAAILPFFLLRLTGPRAGLRTALALLAVTLGILVMAPLFVVATDWGRWIGMYVFTLAMLAIAGLRLGLIVPQVTSASPLFLIYGMVWSMPDFPGADFTLGVLGKVLRAVERLA